MIPMKQISIRAMIIEHSQGDSRGQAAGFRARVEESQAAGSRARAVEYREEDFQVKEADSQARVADSQVEGSKEAERQQHRHQHIPLKKLKHPRLLLIQGESGDVCSALRIYG